MPTAVEIAPGLRLGRWTVLGPSTEEKRGRKRFDCVCDCGVRKSVDASHLRRGQSRSCGCLSADAATKHGCDRGTGASREYKSWLAMWRRVRGTNDAQTKRLYSDRGITACDRWLKFENFLADMGPRPPGTTLDRKNNDGNYAPDNCHWATPSQQSLNTRIGTRNTSGIRGVSWNTRTSRWIATFRGKHLGRFERKGDAQAAYDRARSAYECQTSTIK